MFFVILETFIMPKKVKCLSFFSSGSLEVRFLVSAQCSDCTPCSVSCTAKQNGQHGTEETHKMAAVRQPLTWMLGKDLLFSETLSPGMLPADGPSHLYLKRVPLCLGCSRIRTCGSPPIPSQERLAMTLVQKRIYHPVGFHSNPNKAHLIQQLEQGCPTLFLEIYHPVGFHSNPNKAHLIQQLEQGWPTLFLEIYHPVGFHSNPNKAHLTQQLDRYLIELLSSRIRWALLGLKWKPTIIVDLQEQGWAALL